MSSDNENKIRKTLLTPCRRQGLKRKSLESTLNTSHDFADSQSPCAMNTILNRSSAYSDAMKSTPERHVIEKPNIQVEKKPKVQQDESDKVPPSESIENDTLPHHEEDQDKDDSDSHDQDNDDIDSQIEKIKKRISEKNIEIEKLELDSKNVKQHDLNDLNLLISKWRRGCQAALKDLSQEYQNRDSNLTLPILLNQLGIPQALVHYSETDMDFK